MGQAADVDKACVELVRSLAAYTALLLVIGLSEIFEPDVANQILPISLVVGCLVAGINMVRRAPISALSTYPWILAAIALFHGVGSLAPVWANDATQSYVNAHYKLNADLLLRTNILNLAGTLAICIGIILAYGFLRNGAANRSSHSPFKLPLNRIWQTGMVAFVIGAPIHFLIEVPAQFGWLPFTVPGSLLTLGKFVHVSLILFGFAAARGMKPAQSMVAMLSPAVFLAALLTFSKEAVLLATLMPFLGAYLGSGRLRPLVYGFGACACLYIVLVPVINQARVSVARNAGVGAGDGAPLIARVDSLRAAIGSLYSEGTVFREPSDERQIWWSRLCYNNVQAYAMDEYDRGSPGWSLRHAAVVWIPRFLWPSKPVTGNTGYEFARQYTGRMDDKTAIGIGVFGEAYWVGGWFGLCLGALLIGMELSVMSKIVFAHYRNGDVMDFLCCFLYGIWCARSIDKWIVMNFVGSIPIYAGLYLISRIVQQQTKAISASWR